MNDDIHRLADFLKIRLALLVGSALVIATGTLGLVDLLSTTSVDAIPLYVHIMVGAAVFPIAVFVLEYHGIEMMEAVQLSAGAVFVIVFFLLLMTEGAGRMTNGVLELGVSTVFYVATISLVSSTLIVVWVGNVYLDVPASARESRRKAPRRD